MRLKASFLLLAACLSASALIAEKNTPSCKEDACMFREAQNLSYDGYHEKARELFRHYKAGHPDDFLSVIRMDYDYLFDVNASPDEYAMLLRDVDAAIARFETLERAHTPCAGTDLKGIAHGTLDCNYVGAALYSFREAIRIKKEGKFADWSANGRDDRKFAAYADASAKGGCLEAQFLLAVHEYEAGTATFIGIPHVIQWALKRKGIPADRDHAVRRITSIMQELNRVPGTGSHHEGWQNPFADDIRFYVLRIELEHEYGWRALSKEIPPAALIGQLQPKYPHNRMFQNGIGSFSDTFEAH